MTGAPEGETAKDRRRQWYVFFGLCVGLCALIGCLVLGALVHSDQQTINNKDTGVIKVLVNAGVDVKARDNNGGTALDEVLANTGLRADVVQALVNAKADVNLADQNGQSPLQIALGKNIRPSSSGC